MSKILNWIKKHIWQTILIVLGLFFLPLILVHIAYRITAVSSWFASTWEAGELITYIAGFEAFLGTVVLGSIAVHLNEKSNLINSKLLSLEKRRSIFERQPNIKLTHSEITTLTLEELFNTNSPFYTHPDFPSRDIEELHVVAGRYYYLILTLENNSSFAIDVSVQSFVVEDSLNGKLVKYHKTTYPFGPSEYSVAPAYSNKFPFVLDDLVLTDGSIIVATLILSIINSAGDRYKMTSSFVVCSDYSISDPKDSASLYMFDYKVAAEDD